MLNTTHQEIAGLRNEIRRVVAMVLRSSRFFTDDHIDECYAHVMTECLDYGARWYDPSKGSAKSTFTSFAKCRAKNWVQAGCRRFEVADESTDEDGEVTSHSAMVPAEGNPELSLFTARERARVLAAVEKLEERERALVGAFLRLGSWMLAAKEIGVSPATASRMKADIVAKLQAFAR